MKRFSLLRRFISFALSAAIILSLFTVSASAALQTRQFTLSMAQQLALTNSSAITKTTNQIILKKVKYTEAVEGIKAKVKNLRTFRWTPLLSFKLPEQLNLVEEYDLNIKPIVLQTEIKTLTHALNDLRYGVISDVTTLFQTVYVLQETTAFAQRQLDDAKSQLQRNNAKFLLGNANQSDVDKAQKNVDALTQELSAKMKNFELAKGKLSDMVGLDVKVGYTFANGLKTADIPRSALTAITDYTLNNDQIYYELKATASTAKLNLDSYESLMKNQYGSKMNNISTFISAARNGRDVDYAAFQLQYKEMLKKLDLPWNGKRRILFFSFTLEWFKGEISGTNYIEDEMYAVYTACMEYANALRDKATGEKELRSQVQDGYNTLQSSWRAYETLLASSEKLNTDAKRLVELNRIGKADYSEVLEAQQAYQEAQIDVLEALQDYNLNLNNYDDLTCGAITKYLKDGAASLAVGESGDAFAALDPINEPYYYIQTSVADLVFNLGVSIPNDFSPAIDRYEIWIGDTQIGLRTPISEEIQHLTLDYGENPNIVIRFYNGERYVTECVINSEVPRDLLNLEGEHIPDAEIVTGSYTLTPDLSENVSTSTLAIQLNGTIEADYFTLTYGEYNIFTTEKIAIDESFTYLNLLLASLDNVSIQLYSNDGTLVTEAYFDTKNLEIIAPNPLL